MQRAIKDRLRRIHQAAAAGRAERHRAIEANGPVRFKSEKLPTGSSGFEPMSFLTALLLSGVRRKKFSRSKVRR
jgi:hypothetical protein